MIIYAFQAPHRYTIEKFFLSHKAPRLAKVVRPVSYDQLLRWRWYPFASYIFSDIERLTIGQQEQAAGVWSQLEAQGLPLLNHPTRSLKRYQLLRRLREAGLNHFDVYRLTEDRAPSRFPVFLRGENDHAGPLTDLLWSQQQLDATVARLLEAGTSLDAMIAVEFIDTSSDGLFAKHGDYYVHGRVIPQHVYFSDDPFVKHSGGTGEAAAADQIAFEARMGAENPYADQISNVFRLARLDFGRIDYGVINGKIQVFEINTNPHIVATPGHLGPREANRTRFLDELSAALEQLDTHRAGQPIRARTQPGPRRRSHDRTRRMIYHTLRLTGQLRYETRVQRVLIGGLKRLSGFRRR